MYVRAGWLVPRRSSLRWTSPSRSSHRELRPHGVAAQTKRAGQLVHGHAPVSKKSHDLADRALELPVPVCYAR
jgi:hypothetical protein